MRRMQNWRTSLAGTAAALGVAAQQLPDPPWMKVAGLIVSVAGLVAVGFFAADAEDQARKGPAPATPAIPPASPSSSTAAQTPLPPG